MQIPSPANQRVTVPAKASYVAEHPLHSPPCWYQAWQQVYHIQKLQTHYKCSERSASFEAWRLLCHSPNATWSSRRTSVCIIVSVWEYAYRLSSLIPPQSARLAKCRLSRTCERLLSASRADFSWENRRCISRSGRTLRCPSAVEKQEGYHTWVRQSETLQFKKKITKKTPKNVHFKKK